VSIDEGSFSPDGTTLAVPVALGHLAGAATHMQLVLVDLRTLPSWCSPTLNRNPTQLSAHSCELVKNRWLFYTATDYARLHDTWAMVPPKARIPSTATYDAGPDSGPLPLSDRLVETLRGLQRWILIDSLSRRHMAGRDSSMMVGDLSSE